MIYCYTCFSTDDQDLDQQKSVLFNAGCRRFFEEKPSDSAQHRRVHLNDLLRFVRKGDVLLVTRLEHLASSTRDLLELVEYLQHIGVGLHSLAEPWADTTSSTGRMVLTALRVFVGVTEFERTLALSRTGDERLVAQQKDVRFGRPPALAPDHVVLARRLVTKGQPVREVARLLKVHRATLYRELAKVPGSPT